MNQIFNKKNVGGIWVELIWISKFWVLNVCAKKISNVKVLSFTCWVVTIAVFSENFSVNS